MKYPLADLLPEQHFAICDALCPGCKYKLPEYSEGGHWIHRMPDTDFTLPCRANAYRRERGNQINESK